jgi:uncharacterized damage-inducible protein DinB
MLSNESVIYHSLKIIGIERTQKRRPVPIPRGPISFAARNFVKGTWRPSMSEVERIADQLRRAFEGPAWHGPSIKELLADVTATKAAARPLAGGHSIWEIVLHIKAWEEGMRLRLAGERAELTEEEQWPPITDTSEGAWRDTLAALERAHLSLRAAVTGLDDARLSQPIVKGMSSVYDSLHGVIQHDLYHAGQIALLKRA